MKICWDTLEKLEYDKDKDYWRQKVKRGTRLFVYSESCKTCGEPFLRKRNSNIQFCCHECFVKSKDNPFYDKKGDKWLRRNIPISDETRKKLSDGKIGTKNSFYGKSHSKNTKELLSKLNSKEKNKFWKGGVIENNIALYDTYAHQLSYCESVRKVFSGWLQVKCAYCGKWYVPTRVAVQNRIQGLEGTTEGENRFYCSSDCKHLCPIYGQKLYSAEETNTKQLSREVQPELRQLVFERDGWLCKKCGSDKSLTCHHLEGILWEPLQSADVDMCITYCKQCHKETHKKDGCSYYDMQCRDLEQRSVI